MQWTHVSKHHEGNIAIKYKKAPTTIEDRLVGHDALNDTQINTPKKVFNNPNNK